MTAQDAASARRARSAWRRRLDDDRGSTIPLILGFFLIALLVVAGSIALADAQQDQRNLQGICDGAVLAGVNGLDPNQLYNSNAFGSGDALPLGELAAAHIDAYLERDAARLAVEIESAQLGAEGALRLTCVQRMDLAFGAMFGRSDGVTHRATATATARLGPLGR